MLIEGLHEKEIFTEKYPFRLSENTVVDFEYPKHWHHAVELVYVLKNSFEVLVNHHSYPMKERDILFIASGDVHSFYTMNNKGSRFFIQFDLSMLDAFGNLYSIMPMLSQTISISSQTNAALHACLEQHILSLIDEYNKKDFAYELALNARIFDILITLSRSFVLPEESEPYRPESKKTNGLEKLNRAFQYIEEHYQEKISLKDVSRSAGFSEFHFSRIFHKVAEKSFSSFLNETRVKKAEKLLAGTNITVAEAAHAAGFNSLSTFNRVFKELKGCSPKAFKKLQV